MSLLSLILQHKLHLDLRMRQVLPRVLLDGQNREVLRSAFMSMFRRLVRKQSTFRPKPLTLVRGKVSMMDKWNLLLPLLPLPKTSFSLELKRAAIQLRLDEALIVPPARINSSRHGIFRSTQILEWAYAEDAGIFFSAAHTPRYVTCQSSHPRK